MSDSLCCGRRFWVLSVIDENTRQALEIAVNKSLPTVRGVRELEQIKSVRGKSKRI
jgi:hypothetical protein